MNPLLRLAVVAVTAAWALPLAAFEGHIHFDMKSGKDVQQIVYSLKDRKARFEMVGTPMASIIDGQTNEMFMLMPEQKMYMTMKLDTAADLAGKATPSNVKFEDTGETETILGKKCRKFRLTDRDSTTDMWAAEGMGTYLASFSRKPGGKNAPMPAWQRELVAKGYFPLRVVQMNKKGKETYRMEATKLDATKLADSVFEVPAGFTKFSLGGMMKGMLPGSN